MFLKLEELGQDYVIRLTAKRKLYFHGKWVSVTQLRNQRKGKIRAPLIYKGKKHDAYLSHVKVHFCYYRLAKGISGVLSYAKEGIRLWFRTKRPVYHQLCLKLTA